MGHYKKFWNIKSENVPEDIQEGQRWLYLLAKAILRQARSDMLYQGCNLKDKYTRNVSTLLKKQAINFLSGKSKESIYWIRVLCYITKDDYRIFKKEAERRERCERRVA